jgi:hypothetical protein
MAFKTAKQVAAEKKAAEAAKGTKGIKTQQVQSKELATRTTNTAIAVASEVNFMEDAGNQDFGREDLAIPRISIIQSNSPQVKKAEGKFIKGAEEGDFLETVTNEIFAKGDEGFLFIPAAYRRTDIEWIPRKAGGGFVQDHGNNSGILAECQKDEETGAMVLKNGNEIVTTGEYIGLAVKENGEHIQVAISLAKTGLSVSRQLNTKITTLQVPRPDGKGTFNPAMFYSAFRVKSIPQTSKKTGDSYMGWNFSREADTVSLENGNDLYMEARGLRQSVEAGNVKVAQGNQDAPGEVDDDSSL